MADTLVDPIDPPEPPADAQAEAPEPVPPTQRDPEALALPAAQAEQAPEAPPEEPPEQATPAPRPPRRAARVALAALIGVAITLGLVALTLWAFVLRYEPTAKAHVPAGVNVAIRIEAADVALFGPVREHLLPLALSDKPTLDVKPSSKGKSRAARIHDRTGVRLPTDLREAIVASMDGKSWVAAFGGRIEPGRFVAGLAEVAREEGWSGFRKEGELLVGPTVVIGQAEDGTILVGTDRSIVEAALPATEEGDKLGLPEKGAVTFAIRRPAWEAASGAAAVVRRGSVLGAIERGTGALVLGASPELVLRLEPTKPSDAPALEEGARALLRDLGLAYLLLPDFAGEKGAIRAATVAREGEVIVLRAPWPYEGLDRGAARLARALRGEEPDKAVPKR